MLKKLDELGIADDTIVLYSTDNGPHFNSWPDAGITPFRSEKNTNWEGAFRVPAFARWPGKFPAGKILNGIVSHQDWLPTLLAAAGDPHVTTKLLKGHTSGRRPSRCTSTDTTCSPTSRARPRRARASRSSTSTTTASSSPCASATGSSSSWSSARKQLQCWLEPFVELRAPKIFNLRRDPVRAGRRELEHVLRLVPGPRVRARSGAGVRRGAPAVVPRVPAAAEAGVVQPRRASSRTCRRPWEAARISRHRVRREAPLPSSSGPLVEGSADAPLELPTGFSCGCSRHVPGAEAHRSRGWRAEPRRHGSTRAA